MSEPRIYVACLASYNAGILHGDWIELDGSEDLWDRINEILAQSSIEDAEEWAVHDHEYCGTLSEYPGTDTLKGIQEAWTYCNSHPITWESFIGYCEYLGEPINPQSAQEYQDHYAGTATNLVSWCEDHLEETGQLESIPQNLRYYFNFEAYARDIEINDVFTVESNHEVLVFWRG